MEKIKFKNTKKYKGIVEKVFVKEGQPVKKDEVLAVISTQLEKFEVSSTIEGVIRNIYVIESLIVSHGDTIFDIFSDKEINSLLKKSSNINDTLREGLNEFGYLEKLINEPESNSYQENIIEVADSLTKELSNLSELENQYYQEVGVTESLDQIKNYFGSQEDYQTINVSSFLKEDLNTLDDNLEEAQEEFYSFDPPKFNKTESNIIDSDIKPVTLADSITEELAINHAIVFEVEKDIEIFSDHNPVVSETQVLRKVSNQNFLSNFTSEAEGKEIQTETLFADNKEQEDQKIEEVKAEIDKEKKVENDKKEFSLYGLKFDYLSEFENEKLENLLKSSEELENKFFRIKNQKEELEDKIKNIDNKINQYSSKLKNEFENLTKEISIDKFHQFDEQIAMFILKAKEESSQTINSLIQKVNDKIKYLDTKIKDSANLLTNSQNSSSITEKTLVVDKTNIGSFSYKLDITALISLQILMIEPLKEKGIDLELNAFYVKGLTKTLTEFKELNSTNSAIRLVKTDGFNLNNTLVKTQNDSSILDISKEINNNIELKNEKIKVSLFDLSNFGIDNANFGLSKESIVSIYISTISNSFKEDGNLSNFIKVNFVFNQNILEAEDAILFGKEFISLLKNPGFLI